MPAKTKSKAAAVDTAATPTVTAIKGFDENLSCRGLAYELGQTYTHEGEVVPCRSGFHAIEGHPLEVLSYYPPAGSRFALVECGGAIERHSEDSKIASAQITISAEIHLPELIERAVKFVCDRATWIKGSTATGDGEGVKNTTERGAATASGDGGAATASGDYGAATASGEQGAATASGWRGAATASGGGGAATASGNCGAATASGSQGAATASGRRGAATASGSQGAATASGWWGAATASGFQGAATASGRKGAATALADSVSAHASGYAGKARGVEGAAIHLDERDEFGKITAAWAAIVGRDGIKPMTWYTLRNGKPVEVA